MAFHKQVILFLLWIISATLAHIICSDTHQLISGTVGRMSCNYDLLFISVRWYKENSTVPIAVLERGKRIVGEGYGVSDNGTLIINTVGLSHEGQYRISVLDRNGDSNIQRVKAFVIVALAASPDVQSCYISMNKLCNGIKHGIVCQTSNTKPAVTFSWFKISSNRLVEIDPQYSWQNVSMNQTTKLFTSTSIFKYDHHSFVLQHFTCKPEGLAVLSTTNASVFVEGVGDADISIANTKMLEKGSTLTLNCSDMLCSLRRWRVTYPNGTDTLLEIFPNGRDGIYRSCVACSVDEEGQLTLSNIMHLNEGSFECLCSNGDKTIRNTNEIIVKITPKPKKVVIDECEDSIKCERNVDHRGTLKTSVFGARPRVKIICKVDIKAESTAFLFNEQTSIKEHKEEGTFDTLYTIEYKIPECSNPVNVMCYVSSDSVHKDITAANILLITDPSTCHYGRPGLIVFLVVLFVIIFVAFLIGIIGRKKVLKLFGRLRSRGQRKKTKDSEKATTNQSSQNHELQELMSDENLDFTSEKEIEVPGSQQEKFKQIFDPFISKVIKGEGTLNEFNSILETFSKVNEVKQLAPLLSNFLVKGEEAKKDLTAIVKFLDGIKPNKWISHLDFLNILNELTTAQKLSGDRTLQLFEEYTKNETISLANYVTLTGSLLAQECITVTLLLMSFKSIVDELRQSRLSFAEAFLQYYLLEYITEKVAVEEIISFANKSTIPLRYFFQSTYLQYGEDSKVQHNPKLFSIFMKLLEKMKAEESQIKLFQMNSGEKIKQNTASKPIHKFMEEGVDYKGQDLSSIFIEVVICSVETEDDFRMCKQMLQLAQERKLLTPDGSTDAFVSCVCNEWIIGDFQTRFLGYILSKGLITTESQQHSCFLVLLEKNGLESFFNCLYSCYKNKSITNTFVSGLVFENIKSGKINKDKCTKTLKRLKKSEKGKEAENFAKEIVEAAIKRHKHSSSKKTKKS